MQRKILQNAERAIGLADLINDDFGHGEIFIFLFFRIFACANRYPLRLKML
jgi:hypothetical protein